jgi:hypothetical protein
VKLNLTQQRQHWQKQADSEPDRLDAFASMLLTRHCTANGREQFRLAVMIAQARAAASDLRAMRAARQRLAYSQSY